MDAKKQLLLGENGTKRYVHEYGDRLRCVRYRYDEEKKRLIIRVETLTDQPTPTV